MELFFINMKSPVGTLYLYSDGQYLRRISFTDDKGNLEKQGYNVKNKSCNILISAKTQLSEYFQGERKTFHIPYQLEGTEFQKKAWRALSKIKFGETVSYQEQAKSIQSPLSMRAVGRANGQNPLPILLPCHRVIGKSGKLVGYNGGLNIKEYLLSHEVQSSS